MVEMKKSASIKKIKKVDDFFIHLSAYPQLCRRVALLPPELLEGV